MPNRNWGLINSGECFEALATTLIFFEDHQAKLFGRRGKDGGQDARSGDGSTVFQAKYHESGSAARAIADAKSEAGKIESYRRSGHSREAQWAGVTHWTLVTNAEFNPTDNQKWDDEVVPLFKSLELNASYWERARVDALLDKHPEVDRSFFRGEMRVFLTIPEAELAALKEMPIHWPEHLPVCVGRDTELDDVGNFLKGDRLVLMISGPGGVGKTRLLLEAGAKAAVDGEWQVLWALKDSMKVSSAWFDAVQPERKTLLLIDEPEDEGLLKQLFEQVAVRPGRASQWKIALTVRSPKDPVVKFLEGPRVSRNVERVPVHPLDVPAAESMCHALLGSSGLASQPEDWRNHAANVLSQRFERYPMWLVLAVHVLERHGDLAALPDTVKGLAQEYLDEAATKQTLVRKEQIYDILRWVALLGPVNQQDQASMEMLRERIAIADEAQLREILKAQVTRRLFVQRGAYDRLLELKPDVLRDQVLLDWLVEERWYGPARLVPSDAAQALVGMVLDDLKRGQLGPLQRSILTSLGRTELIFELSDRPVPLLATFYQGVADAMSGLTASTRVLLAQILPQIAPYNPTLAVHLCCLMRTSHVTSETVKGLLRDRQITQDDVVLELAWAVFHAAIGARTPAEQEQVLDELLSLVGAEDEMQRREPAKHRNDGKRAASLVKRVLEGGPQFWGDFEAALSSVAERMLDRATYSGADDADLAALRALLIPAVSVERTQTWSEGFMVRFSRHRVQPDSPAGETRARILQRARATLDASDSSIELRKLAWELLIEAHGSAYQCLDDAEGRHNQLIRSELLCDLRWAKELISRRRPGLDELSVARQLWHWHYRYDGDQEIREESARLESLYQADDLAAEFEPLLGRDGWEEQPQRAREKAKELAAQPDGSIERFLLRAERVPNIGSHWGQMLTVALALGAHALESDAVRGFIRQTMASPNALPGHANFAAVATTAWMAGIRKADPNEVDRSVDSLLRKCTEANKRILIGRLYGDSFLRPDIGTMCQAEHQLVRSLADWFHQHGCEPQFIEAVSWTVDYDWEGLQQVVESTLDRTPRERIDDAVIALVQGIYWFAHRRGSAPLPSGINVWLLDQWIRVPDVGRRGDMLLWQLGEIIKVVGRVSVHWLVRAVQARRKSEQEHGLLAAPAVDGRGILTRFVERLSHDAAQDPPARSAVAELLDFEGEQTSVNYYLPSLLRGIDPNGFVVPSLIADRIRLVGSEDQPRLLRLARFASAYPLGGEPWRVVARVALDVARHWTAGQRQQLYSVLSISHGPTFFGGVPGEAPPIFAAKAQAARDFLERESEDLFRPFWEWHVNATQSKARDWEERAKEERPE